METLILGWYVLVETESVLLLTLFASLQYIGTLLAPMFGVMGDRIGHRNLLCAMRAVYTTLATTLMTFAFMGVLTPVHVFVIAASDGPGAPFGHRDARRGGRRHHARRSADGRDGHSAHDPGFRQDRGRAHRRGARRNARHGPRLSGGRKPLRDELVS